MKLSIYGKGCKECDPLTANAQEAEEALGLGLAVEIEKVTEMNAIIDKGVMRTPVLGVDAEVVSEKQDEIIGQSCFPVHNASARVRGDYPLPGRDSA